VDEYLCLTLLSDAGEEQSAFALRLSRFWTQMLRTRRDDFAKVYAERTAFENDAGRWTRQYLVEESVLSLLERELGGAGIQFAAIDRDDVFSKYEATPPEWMQIEH
jgi:hypothetical protein